MTIEKEALRETVAAPAGPRDGSHRQRPGNSGNVAHPNTGTDHHISRDGSKNDSSNGSKSGSENVFELVDQLTLEVIHLKIAQRSNRRIALAMGIVMNQLHVDDSQAFDTLRRISQNSNRKLRFVAEDVIRDRRILGGP